jgi:glucose/arabinose dehydrogenase
MAPRSSRARAGLVLAASIALATVLLGGASSPAAGQGARGVGLQRIGTFDSPVYVAQPPGQRKLLFVVEQPGSIRVLRSGDKLKRPFLNLRDKVRYGGEQGLLSVAFDPHYGRNRRFFVYYVDNHGDIRVDSLRAKRGDPTRADPSSRRKVIGIAHPVNSNHNGGQLQFGPDGLLYVGTGDGGGAGDTRGNAQNRDVLLGKLLRIKPGRKGGHSSPQSNPFAAGPGRDEIYSLGLRNPYRFSFDRKTGDLWIGDVGQDRWEEIDHESLAQANGANFGWNLLEGNHGFEGDPNNPPANYRPPVLEYSSAGRLCTVIGGYVARDPHLPALAGRYLYADLCGGSIRSFNPGAPGPSDTPTGLKLRLPSSFGEARNGTLFVASLDGPVYRIVQR